MRGYALILLTLLIIPFVSATIEDHWVFSGQPLTIGSDTYYVHVSKDYASLLVQTNGTSRLLSLHECDEINFIRFCYADVAPFEDAEHTRSTATGGIERAVLIQTEQLGPSPSLTIHPPGDVLLNQPASILIQVTNTGNRQLENTSLHVSLNTTAYTLTQCTPHCTLTPLSATAMLGTIPAGSGENVSLTIIPIHYAPGRLIFNLTGTYKEKTLSLTRDLTLSQQKPYTLTIPHTRQEADVGKTLTWTISVKNIASVSLPFTFQLTRPRLLQLTHNLTNLTLPPNQTVSFSLTSTAYYSGTYPINLTLTTRYAGENLTEKITLTDTRTSSTLELIPSTRYEKPISLSDDTLTLHLKNTAGKAFKNITITLIGFKNETLHIPRIGINEEKTLTLPVTYPRVNHTTQLSETIILTYKTFFDEDYTTRKTLSVSVHPLNESLIIQRTITPANPAVGESFSVTLKARKDVDQPLQVLWLNDTLTGALIQEGSTRTLRQPTSSMDVMYGYTAKRVSPYLVIRTQALVYGAGQRALATWEYTLGTPPEETRRQEASTTPEENTPPQENTSTHEREETTTPSATSVSHPAKRKKKKGFLDMILDFFFNLFSPG